MPLTPGTRLGPYQITALIGAGGMGEVYAATDTRLGRTVAIKALPAELAADPARREHFEREAKAIAALNHPHICTLYEFNRYDGVEVLVMEHLAGESLQDRLTKGALPLDQALQVAIQIADALDKAHRQGITHRDLKPGNIFLVGKSGAARQGSPQAKLLDFGLAKLTDPVRSAGQPGDASTKLADALTAEGTILGTFHYMAPEQLEGREADARSDIWAFGCVLYEMVTGQKAFEGTSQASLISSIMKDEPRPVSTVASLSPPMLDRVIQTCLAKDPDRRWHSVGDIGRQLGWVSDVDGGRNRGDIRSSAMARERWVWGGLVLALGVATGLAFWNVRGPAPVSAVVRLVLNLPPGYRIQQGIHPIAMAPSGSRVVYAATRTDGRESQLFVHELDQFNPVAISGTVGASDPFFSPDDDWVGFRRDDRLQRVSVKTGAILNITDDVAIFRGASWGADDTIVFSDIMFGLRRVPARGGAHESVTVSDDAGLHRFPHILPGGTQVMFTVGSGDVAKLAALSIETGEWHVLPNQGLQPQYAGGYITYGQGDSLLTQSFDLEHVTTTGDPRPILQELGSAAADGAPVFAVSASGSLAYVEGRPQSRLVWVDRSGQVAPLGDRADNPWIPRLSPSGQHLATILIERATQWGLWILDLERGTRTRVTPANALSPTWRPNGTHLAYQTDASGTWRPVLRALDGGGAEETLIPGQTSGEIWVPTSWTPDGATIALTVGNPSDGWDIWVVSPGSAPAPLVAGPADDVTPAISPDGRRVAYASNASGRFEVYLRAIDAPSGTVVSSDGGIEPRWSRDGRELFYRSGNRMMVIAVLPDRQETGVPQVVFEGQFMMSSALSGGAVSAPPNYDVSLDGERFLMVQEDPSSVPTQIHVVHGWLEEFRTSAP